jgi:hypothetical protein
MATYQRAPDEVESVMNALIEQKYPDLVKYELTWKVIFAYPTLDEEGAPKGNAISVLGGPALWNLKVNSLKERAAGMPDVLFVVDGDEFGKMPRLEQDALLCEVLDSFTIATDKEGSVKADDLGRPKIKKLPPDAVVTLRVKTAEEYKEAAPCFKSMAYAGRLMKSTLDTEG